MGKVLISCGSGSGTASEDVTAAKKHVLAGRTTVTADSDDEIVSGTMPDNTSRSSNGNVPGLSSQWETVPVRQALDVIVSDNTDGVRRICIRVPEGYYPDNQCFVARPATDLGNASPDEVLSGNTYTSEHGLKVPGTMKDCGSGGQITYEAGWDHEASCIYARLPGGNGYYHDHRNKPWVYVSREQLMSIIGLHPDHWLDNINYMGVQGKVPRWVCTTGDVVSALNNEGYWYDDAYAGRGRGIMVRIPNGHRIEGANWVFLPSPNLHSVNIRAGVNINGVQGSLVDYGAGRVAFNGATFDGALVSRVANSEYKGILAASGFYIVQGNIHTHAQYGYFDGIQNGGLQIRVSAGNRTSSQFAHVGFALGDSINLTPFRTIRIGYHLSGSGSTSYSGNSVVKVAASIAGIGGFSEGYVNAFRMRRYTAPLIREKAHDGANSAGIPGAGQNYFDVDVAGLQEQHYIAIGANAYVLTNNDNVTATVIINHIEFIN